MSDIHTVTDDEARAILSRFIASHFRKPDHEHARFSIPAREDRDDDLSLSRYITETAALRERVKTLEGKLANAEALVRIAEQEAKAICGSDIPWAQEKRERERFEDLFRQQQEGCRVANSRAESAEARAAKLGEALRSIAANTCCDRCQEAALVARAALSAPEKEEDRG
jgi:flagellar biosynthesis/type III secretory pathway chaperone